MSSTQIKSNTNLSDLFIFEDAESDAHIAYMEEIGTLIFQSALMQYLSAQDNDKAKIFESFILLNIDKEIFLDLLCQEYPDFEEVLREELSAFKSEINF